MTELKTLKDMPLWDSKKKVIKAEAIKWVKEDIKDFMIDINGEPTMDCQLTRGWMKRLNITEKDLK